jgi:hypothetical protein
MEADLAAILEEGLARGGTFLAETDSELAANALRLVERVRALVAAMIALGLFSDEAAAVAALMGEAAA